MKREANAGGGGNHASGGSLKKATLVGAVWSNLSFVGTKLITVLYLAVLARLATSGSLPNGAGPAELDAHIRREIARWDKVLKTAGVQLK